jgi:hypothetical protein
MDNFDLKKYLAEGKLFYIFKINRPLKISWWERCSRRKS